MSPTDTRHKQAHADGPRSSCTQLHTKRQTNACTADRVCIYSAHNHHASLATARARDVTRMACAVPGTSIMSTRSHTDRRTHVATATIAARQAGRINRLKAPRKNRGSGPLVRSRRPVDSMVTARARSAPLAHSSSSFFEILYSSYRVSVTSSPAAIVKQQSACGLRIGVSWCQTAPATAIGPSSTPVDVRSPSWCSSR